MVGEMRIRSFLSHINFSVEFKKRMSPSFSTNIVRINKFY